MTEIMARINAEGRVELIDDRSARIESAANMTPFDTVPGGRDRRFDHDGSRDNLGDHHFKWDGDQRVVFDNEDMQRFHGT